MKYFNQEGHLDEEGISLCVDALRLELEENLPANLREHASGCTACLQQIADLYAVTKSLDYSDLPLHPVLEAAPSAPTGMATSGWFSSIGLRLGVLAIVATLSWWALQPTSQTTAPRPDSPTQDIHTAPPAPAPEADSIAAPPANRPIATPTPTPAASDSQPDLYAANFEANDDWEALVGGTTRAQGGLVINSPTPGARFAPGSTISFGWDGLQSKLHLKIYNNQGEPLINQFTGPNFSWKAPAIPGLYYWSLENEEDLQYVGKFAVTR